MKNITSIFEKNKTWVQSRLAEDPDYFQRLATGQKPEILYIGCSDSRVTAEELMGVGPGEVFVHRNIANMVPNTDLSAMSVIEYAVKYLEVDHIVVCGHYGCGGVKAAMEAQDLGILNPWLRNIRDVYRMHRDELDPIEDTELRYRRLIELNVLEQATNTLKTAATQRAVRLRGLTVHGWVFDLATGNIVDLNIDFKAILANITKIYDLLGEPD